MSVKIGLDVNQFMKYVINQHVVHVGHLELLRQCLIVYVLHLDKKSKPEFQLKIY